MFIDASALVAMIANESGANELAARLGRSRTRLTSPIAMFEASAAVARTLALSLEKAGDTVASFLALTKIEVISIPPEVAPIAIEASARYGKGRGHPAQLNMGDCFAYACARHYGQPLLYKGRDFTQTDIEPA